MPASHRPALIAVALAVVLVTAVALAVRARDDGGAGPITASDPTGPGAGKE